MESGRGRRRSAAIKSGCGPPPQTASREEGRADGSREEGRKQQLQSRRAERLQRTAANGTRERKLQSAVINRQ